MSSNAIHLESVSKAYRIWHEKHDSLKARLLHRGQGRFSSHPVLHDVSLDIAEGTTFGFIGSNGAGKSTILKLIARILVPDAGEVTVAGKVSALLELGAGFHPDLTGRENVYLNGSILGLSRKTLDERFEEIVEFAGIGDAVEHQVKTYSSGMFARLGFAVAVNVEPDVLLIDEALSVGDAVFQRRCAEKINRLRADGRTVVIVSHDLALVRRLCDRVAWVDDGKIQALGDPDDVLLTYEQSIHPDATVDDEGTIRFGTGAARIQRAALRGPSGSLAVGDRLEVSFTVTGAVTGHDLAVGFDIRRGDGVMVTQATSRPQVLRLPPAGDLTVRYCADALPLLPGDYVFHMWLVDEVTGELLDAADHLRFDVHRTAGNSDRGLISLSGHWETPQ